jgi:hypothetical protein
MKFLYVMLLLVGLPLAGMIIGGIITDHWDDIIKSLKGIGSCLGVILMFILGLAVAGIIGNLMFGGVREGGALLSLVVFLGFIALIFSGMKK